MTQTTLNSICLIATLLILLGLLFGVNYEKQVMETRFEKVENRLQELGMRDALIAQCSEENGEIGVHIYDGYRLYCKHNGATSNINHIIFRK